MNFPSVRGWGDSSVESFEEYRKRLPGEINVPECLLENWIYRHWREFRDYWLDLNAPNWSYDKHGFSNREIQEISTSRKILNTLEHWGDELFRNEFRQRSWLAEYMLKHGTFPVPILVLKVDGNMEIPNGLPGEMMVGPYHLVEGHMRTAYLTGMIRHNHSTLKSSHQVWIATAR